MNRRLLGKEKSLNDPIKDANGKVIRRVLATKNKNTSSDLGALKSESDAMIRKAEADDMGLADDVYGQVKGYKISPAKAAPDQTTAITSEQLNILMRNVGEEVDSMIDELPEGVEILADIKGVKGRRVMDWMREERGVALTNRYNQLVKELGKDAADVQFAKELHQKVMQSSFSIFGFVAGVEIECNFQSFR